MLEFTTIAAALKSIITSYKEIDSLVPRKGKDRERAILEFALAIYSDVKIISDNYIEIIGKFSDVATDENVSVAIDGLIEARREFAALRIEVVASVRSLMRRTDAYFKDDEQEVVFRDFLGAVEELISSEKRCEYREAKPFEGVRSNVSTLISLYKDILESESQSPLSIALRPEATARAMQSEIEKAWGRVVSLYTELRGFDFKYR